MKMNCPSGRLHGSMTPGNPGHNCNLTLSFSASMFIVCRPFFLFAAIGAIGVAGLGVLAVFQIANVVAAGTGRSMLPEPRAAASDEAVDKSKLKILEDAASKK